MKYSIVMPVYNNYALTARAVQSIVRHTSSFELILIDNGSSDETELIFSAQSKRVTWLRYVRNEVNVGFTRGLNQGLKLAQGEFCIWLNNDVMVTEYWADKMQSALDCAAPVVGVDRVGLVGPVSNAVAGAQLLDIPWYRAEMVDTVALDVWKANTHKYQLADFLSGFCLMHPRVLLDEIGFADEQFSPGGFEDNDYLLRCQQHGIYAVIALDTFIHHDMSATMNMPQFRSMKGGMINYRKFLNAWRPPKNPTLCTAFTCHKITDVFIQSVRHAVEYSNFVSILLDRLPVDELEKEFGHSKNVVVAHLIKKTTEFERRNFLFQQALKLETDWVLFLDSDEDLEDKVDRAFMRRLMSHPNPHVRFVGFPVFNLWDSVNTWRVDGLWGEMHGPRMFKVLPGLQLISNHPEGLHMYHTPTPTLEATRYASTKIIHYGYLDPLARFEKYQHYVKLDQKLNPERVGADDYSHLISNHYTLNKYKGSQTVSLNLLYNGEFIHALQLLDKLYLCVDEVRIMDNLSNGDGAFIGEVFKSFVISGSIDDDFAAARNKLKNKSLADWILYFDPDEEPHPSFQKSLQRLIEDEVDGWLFTFENLHPTAATTFSDAIRLFKNLPNFKFKGRVHENLDEAFEDDKYKVAQLPWNVLHYGTVAGYKTEKSTIEFYERLNEKSIKENPNDPMAFFNLALCRLHANDEQKARELFTQAAKLKATYFHPRLQLGLTDMIRARTSFQEVQALIPPNHRLRQQVDHVLELLNEAISNNAERP